MLVNSKLGTVVECTFGRIASESVAWIGQYDFVYLFEFAFG